MKIRIALLLIQTIFIFSNSALADMTCDEWKQAGKSQHLHTVMSEGDYFILPNCDQSTFIGILVSCGLYRRISGGPLPSPELPLIELNRNSQSKVSTDIDDYFIDCQ